MISLNGEISDKNPTEGQSPCYNILFIDLATSQHFHKSLLDLNKSCWRNYLWEVHIDKLYSQSLDSRCASLLFKSPSRRYNVKIASPNFHYDKSCIRIRIRTRVDAHSSKIRFGLKGRMHTHLRTHEYTIQNLNARRLRIARVHTCGCEPLSTLHAQSMPKSALASQTGPKSLASSRGRDQSLEGC